jgi:hypothetical protein
MRLKLEFRKWNRQRGESCAHISTDSWYSLTMQLAPLILAGATLLVLSKGKKKGAGASKMPKVEKFGRVERLLNAAAVRESMGAMTPPPTVMMAYTSKTPALERATQAMIANAEAFQNVEFYQMPISALKEVVKVEGAPPKGIAGSIVGVHPDGAIWLGYVFPNDDAKDVAIKVAHRVFFALTGKRPEIKGA